VAVAVAVLQQAELEELAAVDKVQHEEVQTTQMVQQILAAEQAVTAVIKVVETAAQVLLLLDINLNIGKTWHILQK
jgi:response regulator of citrate/malate metabolism